jgi:predicted transcriptional regulator
MKRDKLEIARTILLICKDGAKKTEVVYKSNLNFRNAEVYLKLLNDREMILKEGKLFKITSRGSELLSNLQSTSELMDLK